MAVRQEHNERIRRRRREQILAAALACFAQSGFHATTMAEVASRAGVSKGTPYLYFQSKEALFIALEEDWDCRSGDRVADAVRALDARQRDSPAQVLRAMALAVAGHAVDNPLACRVLMEVRTLAPYYPAIAAAVEDGDARIERQVTELITDGVAAGEWPAGTDAALHAQLVIAGVNGLMAQWHQRPAAFSLVDAVAALLDRLLGRSADADHPAIGARS